MNLIPEVSHFNVAGVRQLDLLWPQSKIHLTVSLQRFTLWATPMSPFIRSESLLAFSAERQEHSVSGKMTVSSPQRPSRWEEAVTLEDAAAFIQERKSSESGRSQEKRD